MFLVESCSYSRRGKVNYISRDDKKCNIQLIHLKVFIIGQELNA